MPCGLTFRERIRTLRIDPKALPAKHERHSAEGRYFDDAPLKEAFGADADTRKEQLMEATKGLGPAKRDTRGELWRRDRFSGDAIRVSDKELDTYLGADTETEAS